MERDIAGDIVDSIPVEAQIHHLRRLTCCLQDDFATRMERDIAGDIVDSIPVGDPDPRISSLVLAHILLAVGL
jgi:hypothetical protein